MNPDSMDLVFQALANPSRRKVLDLVKGMPGCSVNDVCKYFRTSRIAVMKHLRVLEQAELLVSQKNGRTRELFFNSVPIQRIYDRWTTEYSAFWASKVTDLKFQVESSASKETGAARTRGKKSKKSKATETASKGGRAKSARGK